MANVYSTITLKSDISMHSHKLRSMKMHKAFNFHSYVLWISLWWGLFNGQHRLERSPQVFSDRDPLSCVRLTTCFLCASPVFSHFLVNSTTILPAFHTENTSGVSKFLSRKLSNQDFMMDTHNPTHDLGSKNMRIKTLKPISVTRRVWRHPQLHESNLQFFLLLEFNFINMCIFIYTNCPYLNPTTSKFAAKQ